MLEALEELRDRERTIGARLDREGLVGGEHRGLPRVEHLRGAVGHLWAVTQLGAVEGGREAIHRRVVSRVHGTGGRCHRIGGAPRLMGRQLVLHVIGTAHPAGRDGGGQVAGEDRHRARRRDPGPAEVSGRDSGRIGEHGQHLASGERRPGGAVDERGGR